MSIADIATHIYFFLLDNTPITIIYSEYENLSAFYIQPLIHCSLNVQVHTM